LADWENGAKTSSLIIKERWAVLITALFFVKISISKQLMGVEDCGERNV
jgi:hypothetical protein